MRRINAIVCVATWMSVGVHSFSTRRSSGYRIHRQRVLLGGEDSYRGEFVGAQALPDATASRDNAPGSTPEAFADAPVPDLPGSSPVLITRKITRHPRTQTRDSDRTTKFSGKARPISGNSKGQRSKIEPKKVWTGWNNERREMVDQIRECANPNKGKVNWEKAVSG